VQEADLVSFGIPGESRAALQRETHGTSAEATGPRPSEGADHRVAEHCIDGVEVAVELVASEGSSESSGAVGEAVARAPRES
jgi:hypothetical protein